MIPTPEQEAQGLHDFLAEPHVMTRQEERALMDAMAEDPTEDDSTENIHPGIYILVNQ